MKNLKKNVEELLLLFSELVLKTSAETKRTQKVIKGLLTLSGLSLSKLKPQEDLKESYCNFRSVIPSDHWENWIIRKFLHIVHLNKRRKHLTRNSFKFFLDYIKNVIEIPESKEEYPIHSAVFNQNLYKIRQLCIGDDSSFFYVFIDQADPLGNTALMLAVKMRNYEAVQVLVDHGADAKYRLTQSMPSPLEVAIEMNEKMIVSLLVTGYHRDLYANWTENIEEFSRALMMLEDFQVLMSWECISRIIPFIKRFTPSDNYLISKKGNQVKIDLTLVGWEQLKAKRGEISIVFNGDFNRVLLIDHGNKSSRELFGDLNYEQIEKHSQELMKNKKYSTDIVFSECSVEPCKTWRGVLQEREISGYSCKKYEINCGVSLCLHKRPVILEKNLSNIKSIDDYFSLISSKTFKNLLVSGKIEKKSEKFVKVSSWTSSTFPLKLCNFLPIIDLLSSVSQKVRRFSDLLSMESMIKEIGFPLRTKIPIILTVTALISFTNMKLNYNGDESFEKSIKATIDLFEVKSMKMPPSSDQDSDSEDTVLGPKLSLNPTQQLELEEAEETFIKDCGIFEDDVKQKVKMLGSHRSIINKVKSFIEMRQFKGNDVDIDI